MQPHSAQKLEKTDTLEPLEVVHYSGGFEFVYTCFYRCLESSLRVTKSSGEEFCDSVAEMLNI